MNWKYLSKQQPKSQQELIDLLLKNRSIKDQNSFVNPVRPKDLSLKSVGINPKQLKAAAKRIKQAERNQDKVVIFGDYDADGITATSLLWLALREMGITAQPFIPDRQKHGYGISIKALEEIKKEFDPDLIITVDNGIVAHEAVRWANEHEIEVIITDHHQPHKKLPEAVAIVHSTKISGAATAWFLVRELLPDFAGQMLDLVAIATITDQMPLTGANRSFVKHGIEALKKTDKPGLKALYQVSDIDPQKISSYTLGFVLGPRINAVGRLEHGLTAVRLLCTGRLGAAKAIARKLDKTNRSRQDLTEKQLELALNAVGKKPEAKLLFVHSEQFHEGVIGLIAGKLTEKFYRPAIVIDSAGEVSKGSARSVSNVSIIDLIRQTEDLLIDAGGHELAAGFSVKKENIDRLKQKMTNLAEQEIDPKLLMRQLTLDLPLSAKLTTLETARLLDRLKPFGLGNYPPVFAFEKLKVVDAFTMGRNNNHLKLTVKFEDGYRPIQAVGWNRGFWAEQLEKNQPISLAASLDINHWNGKTNLQLKVKDIKPLK